MYPIPLHHLGQWRENPQASANQFTAQVNFMWQIVQSISLVIFAPVEKEVWVYFLTQHPSLVPYVGNIFAVLLLQAVALLLMFLSF